MPTNLHIADPGDNGSKRRRNRVLPPEKELVIVLAITLLIMFVVTEPLYRLLGKSSYIVAEWLIIVPAMVYLIKLKYRWKQVLRLSGISPGVAVMSLLAGLSYIVISDELDRLMNLIYPMPEEIYQAIAATMKINNFFEFITVSVGVIIVAGVVEEALFRGLLQRTLEYRRGVTRAITTSSLIFALIHLNPWWVIQILLLGMLLGIMAWRANSILPCVIVHAVNNGLGLYSANAGAEEIPFYEWNGHISPVVLTIAVALLYWSMKRFFELTKQMHPVSLETESDSGAEEAEGKE